MQEEDYQACLHNALYEQPPIIPKATKSTVDYKPYYILYGPSDQYETEATERINETHSYA